MNKTKKKEYIKFNRKFFWRMFFKDLGSIVCGGMLMLLFLVLGVRAFTTYYTGHSFGAFAADMAFKLSDTDTELVNSIAVICNLEDNDLQKVNCVYDYFSRHFKYKRGGNSLRTLNQSFEGDCDDASYFYCSVFKRLDISCTPVAVENHMFVILDFFSNDYYYNCRIDMDEIDCW